MKKYNRIMLGQAGRFAKMCREKGYIGANFNIHKDLSDSLPDNWRVFNEMTIPLWLENNLNRDFCTFIDKISRVLNVPERYIKEAKASFETICDKIFVSDEEQEQYCKEHNIPY